jgi:hypothetical protein
LICHAQKVNKLKTLLYIPYADTTGERLLCMIESSAVNEEIEIYRKIDSLSRRLREPIYDIDVSIIMTPNTKELSKILLLKERLRDIKTILILPDRETNTIFLAHKLYPRYISFGDSDFKDIGEVLEKMIKNKQRKKRENISDKMKMVKICDR